MSIRRQAMIAVGLGVIGLAGLAVLVMGQVDSLATALQQYETQTKKKVDRAKADDLVAWAKWCYQNDKAAEAKEIAIEGLQKAPDDLRLKFLVYALGGGTGGGGTTEPAITESRAKSVTITREEADKIFAAEGPDAMARFKIMQNQVLIPRCGKCHGGGDEKATAKWALILKSNDERGMLAENFAAVNAYVNRDSRMDSKVLLVPSRSPEAVHTQVFKSATDAGYELMVRWIMVLKGTQIFSK
jgi:hypothetical protein